MPFRDLSGYFENAPLGTQPSHVDECDQWESQQPEGQIFSGTYTEPRSSQDGQDGRET